MELLLLLPLSLMIYEDFQTRNVLLWHLLLFGALQVAVCVHKYGIILTGYQTIINLVILLAIGIAIAIYSFFRFKGKKQPIGWGDILFILLLTPYFSYRLFLYFLISSFTITLIVWVIWIAISKKKSNQIPLVSGVGICYTVVLIYRFLEL